MLLDRSKHTSTGASMSVTIRNVDVTASPAPRQLFTLADRPTTRSACAPESWVGSLPWDMGHVPTSPFLSATCKPGGVKSRIMYVELKTGYNYERLVSRPK